MNPRLVCVAGPLQEALFALNEELVCIGRDVSNQVSLGDKSISRRHCLIKREGDRFELTDLESRNGTFVDGVPVKERVLEHGSRIQIGDLQFLFLLEDTETPQATIRAQLDDSTLIVGTTVQLRKEDALYL